MIKEGFLLHAQRRIISILGRFHKERLSQRTTGSKNSRSVLFKKYPMGFSNRLSIAIHRSSGSSRAKEGFK